MENRTVIIIGAGVGGLAAGYWLCQRGYQVQILEASDRPSGRVVTLEHKGDRVDVGAQFFHNNYRYAFELADKMNLSGMIRRIRGKVQFALRDGSTYLYNPQVPYMKMLGLRGNLKLYWFILNYIFLGRSFPLYRIAVDIPEYDDVEVLDFYSSPSDEKLKDYIVTPMSMGANLGMPDLLSLYHYIHQFRVYTFTGTSAMTMGMASFPQALAECLPLQYEAPVRQLVMDKGRVVGVQMEKDGSIKKAGHVIVAVPPSSAARLMPEQLEGHRRFFDSIIYSPMPMPVFFLDRPLPKDVWCYYNDPSLKKTFMFAINAAAKVPEMVPSGKGILTGWSGHPMTLDLIDRPDNEILREAQEDIALMIPGFLNWIEDAMVFRHPYGVPRFPAGAYRKVLHFQNTTRTLKGVSFVGDLFGGSSIEASVISAAAAVSRVCQWGGTA